MSEIQPRVTGTEMEWPVLVQKNPKDDAQQIDETGAKYMTDNVHSATGVYTSGDGSMLSNGGRYYKDIGDHPEYATPEDTDFMGTVANEIAGEKIVFDTAEYTRHHPENGFNNFRLLKRVIDDDENTSGYHINLAGDAGRISLGQNRIIPMGAHLASINILTGAGAVIPREPNAGGSFYTVAQKSLTLSSDFCANSTGKSNPLISTRDEAHNDNRNIRVHITSLDANMSPWATWMKLGTTSLVMRMIEQGYLDRETYVFDKDNEMFEVGKTVARDIDMEQSFEMENGNKWSALDIQTDLALRARKLADRGLVTNEELAILDEWERALTDMKNNPESLVDRVEWITKRLALERFMARNALTMSSPEVYQKDLQWSYIADDGIGTKLRKTVWAKWMPPLEAIERAYHSAPTTTRAMARAAFIYEHASRKRRVKANWTYMSVDLGGKTHRQDIKSLKPQPPIVIEDYDDLDDNY